MNTKQWVIGTIVGGAVVYALGYVIWNLLFADFFNANSGAATGVDRAEQIVWAVAVGSLTYAVLLMYALGSRAGSLNIAGGAKTGAIVGLLLWATADFTLYGVQDVSNLTATIVDPLLELVRGAIAGAVLAAVVPKLA
jgi:hypothetical protein